MASIINAATSGGLVTTADTSGILQLQTASTTAVTVDASQNVGIGTSSPTSKLTVAGAISVNTGAANLNALGLLSGSSGNRIGLSLGRTAQEAYIGIASTSNSIINGDVAGDLDILTTTGNIRLSTNAGASLQATLDTAGNLGLGVTPSAYNLGKVIELGTVGNAVFGIGAADMRIISGAYYNSGSGGWIYSASGTPISNYGQSGGSHLWYTAPSGTAGTLATFTQAMTLTPAGLLGLGTTTPATYGGFAVRKAVTTADTTNCSASFSDAANSTLDIGHPSAGVVYINAQGSVLAFGAGSAERGRFSTTGGFSVGTTSNPGAGAIYATGNITAFFSDKRLKTVSGKIENALDKVGKLSGVYYTNNDTAKSFGYDSDEVQVGVLAQDVEAVLPQIVKAAPFDLDQDGNSKSGENYKTVQYERLVPLLIEAINELRAEVKALKGE
jgi:hypothetical protein